MYLKIASIYMVLYLLFSCSSIETNGVFQQLTEDQLLLLNSNSPKLYIYQKVRIDFHFEKGYNGKPKNGIFKSQTLDSNGEWKDISKLTVSEGKFIKYWRTGYNNVDIKYDSHGNMVSKGKNKYQYENNQLKEIESPHEVYTFDYFPNNCVKCKAKSKASDSYWKSTVCFSKKDLILVDTMWTTFQGGEDILIKAHRYEGSKIIQSVVTRYLKGDLYNKNTYTYTYNKYGLIQKKSQRNIRVVRERETKFKFEKVSSQPLTISKYRSYKNGPFEKINTYTFDDSNRLVLLERIDKTIMISQPGEKISRIVFKYIYPDEE